jgi:3-deoxy-manno-octulosonate cytidylyltransferase (CMP-KDO synthetase)
MAAQAIGIIPARYGSTRLPAKVLAPLHGKPLVQHVYEQAKRARSLSEVIIATDDERIVAAVERFGGRAVMTSPSHRSGTDRIAEVARTVDAPVFLNIQGDEPLVHPDQLDQIADFLLAHQAVPMATVMTRLIRPDDLASPHVVKVVVDQDGYALYFSRSPIPYIRDGGPSMPPRVYWKHLGLYGYQRHFLLQFPHLPPTKLEQLEQLEQLRALEHGHKIRVLETPHDTVAVDTAADLGKVQSIIAASSAKLDVRSNQASSMSTMRVSGMARSVAFCRAIQPGAGA